MAGSPSIAGMVPTGRKLAGPGVEIRELAAPSGLKHLAFVHHESLRDHPALGPDLQGRLGFLEQPEVGGLARLAFHEAASGTFVYPTGTVWTVAEVVRAYAETGEAPGVKAGLELCYLVAESLVEAAEAGEGQGLGGHGNVNPWTLGLKADGQPVVMLYGVPQVELLAWRDNPKRALTEDAFRYAPPERLEGEGEDLSSDLLSLALVALEVMVGRPVYDGVVADVRQQASRGEGARRLYQWREKLPQNVREVMGRAIKPDPDSRFPNGMDFVYAVHDLLGSIDVEGPSLVEVMARVRASERRQRAAGAKTGALSPEDLKELAADLEEFEDKPLPPPRRARAEEATEAEPAEKPRWTRATRQPERAGRGAAPEPPSMRSLRREGAPAPPTAGPLGSEPPPSARPAEVPPHPGAVSADLPRRRLRGEAPPSAAAPAPLPPPAAGDTAARERLRRRLREPRPQEGAPSDSGPVRRSAATKPEAAPARPEPPPPQAPPPPAAAPPPVAPPPVAPPPPSVGLDLSAPDDVVLEPITGRPPDPTTIELDDDVELEPEPPVARAPLRPAEVTPPTAPSRPSAPPAPPPAAPPGPAATFVEAESSAWAAEALLEDSTAERSAAAALLERLRTTGVRRRRPGSGAGDGVEVAETSGPIPLVPPREPAPAPPPPTPPAEPSGRFGRIRRPGATAAALSPQETDTAVVDVDELAVGALPTTAVELPPPLEPTPPPPAPSTVEVTAEDRAVTLPLRPGEGAGSAALRAAVELGGLPIDATGRLTGAVRLRREGRPVPAAAAIEPGARYELEVVRCDTRVVDLEVDTTPPTRLRTPVALAIPAGWLARDLVAWLRLPAGPWVLRVDGAPVDPHAPLLEVLGPSSALRLARS